MAKEDGRQFRSSMAAILAAIETYGELINDRHMDAMKKTPFYMLLNAVREGEVSAQDCHRGESLTADIVHIFNPTTRKFKFGGVEVGLTRNDVRLIFGIVDGEMPIDLYRGTKPGWNFYNRWFANDVYLNPKVVKDKLHTVFFKQNQTDVDVEDAVRLLCLLLFTTLFVPLKGFSLTWGWVEYVEDLDRMRSYDWSGKILSILIDSLVEKHTDPYKVVGCTMVLPYWLCEHTSVFSARECAESLPRFVRWHLAGLKTLVTRKMLVTLEADKVVVGELVPTDVELAMHASLKEYGGTRGSTSRAVKNKQSKIVDKESPARRTRVDVKKKRVEDDNVTNEKESDSLAKLYSDLVAVHAELQLKYKKMEEENLQMKENLSGLVDASRSNDAELDIYKEKVMILNGELLTSMGETDMLSGKYIERGRERDALSKRVKALEKELAAQKEINRVQSEQIEELNDRWFAAAEPELHAVTQAACAVTEAFGELGKSGDETGYKGSSMNREYVNAVTEASGEMEKSGDEPVKLQNSMIKRLKEKTRKPVVIDDDFEFGSVVVKRMKTGNEPTYFKDNGAFLAMLDRKYPGHCAKLLPTAVLTKLVEKINLGPSESVYCNEDRMTVVDVHSIMNVLRGVYISNSVVDAYGQYLMRTIDPVKSDRTITIISGDCWHRVVKQNSKHVINEVIGAAIKNTGLVLMPILSTGNRNEVGAEHWTLLVMDVDDQEWRFYNSKRPRTNKTVDKYLADAKLLKEKLEIAMAEKSSASLGYKVLESDTHLGLVEVPAPSQGETCDCAIFVCYFMRQLVRNEELKTKMRKDVVRKFKATVVQSIIMP